MNWKFDELMFPTQFQQLWNNELTILCESEMRPTDSVSVSVLRSPGGGSLEAPAFSSTGPCFIHYVGYVRVDIRAAITSRS